MSAPIWPDVAGHIEIRIAHIEIRIADSHADFFARNEIAVVVEQDLRPFGRYAGWIHAPRAALADPGLDLVGLAFSSLEHVFRPWAASDRNPIPSLELFPRLELVTRPARSLWRLIGSVFDEIRFPFG